MTHITQFRGFRDIAILRWNISPQKGQKLILIFEKYYQKVIILRNFYFGRFCLKKKIVLVFIEHPDQPLSIPKCFKYFVSVPLDFVFIVLRVG